MNSRQTAAKIIGQWLETGDFPDRMIADPDRAFVMEVVYGTVRRLRPLKWAIERCSSREPDDEVKPYLLVGAYQLLMMDNVADHAALHETVNAAKSGKARHAVPFINAVFRKIQRDRDSIHTELADQPLAVRESHPDILVERWIAARGKDAAEKLCSWNNSRPEVVIHANTVKASRNDLLAALSSEGIEAGPDPYEEEECIVLPRGIRVPDLPGYKEGFFSVQDPSTLTPVKLLDVKPGQAVLDACAAPGGKMILISEKMGGKGQIIAMDLHEDRLVPLHENIKRMGLENVKTALGDASYMNDMKRVVGDRKFDRILLDVPCTNTGVLRRRPDARWRFSVERMKKIMKIQRGILNCCSRFLKRDGILVYSTCSLEPEEGAGMVESWLAGNPGFELSESVELFPPQTRTDGIYAAAIRLK